MMASSDVMAITTSRSASQPNGVSVTRIDGPDRSSACKR